MACLLLLPFSWPHLKRDWPVVRRHWKILLLLSFLGITCFNTLLYTAVHTTTAVNGSLIQSSMPAWIVLFSWVIFGEPVKPIQGVGLLLCISGAFNIVIRGNWLAISRISFVEGDLLMIVAVCLYAYYSALLKRRPRMSSLGFLSITFIIGDLILLPVYLWENSVTGPLAVDWRIIGSVLYVAVFPSILAYLCWNRAAELIGANRTGLYINFVPVFATILAVLLLDEKRVVFHFIGLLMILGGMVLFNRRRELGASTGIVGATVVTMGLLAVPTMLRNGYQKELATGTVSASGTLGQIIPPSIIPVLLGDILGVPVGDLFMGAVFPGMLLVSLYSIYILVVAWLFPKTAPPISASIRSGSGSCLPLTCRPPS